MPHPPLSHRAIPFLLAAPLLTTLEGCGWLFDGGSDHASSDSSDDGDPPPQQPPGPAPVVEEPFEGECVPAAWVPEQPEPWGAPIALALRGTQVRVDAATAPVLESITAPLRIEPVDPELPVVAFGDATVDELHEGTLVVVGAGIVATAGTIGVDAFADVQLDDARAWVRPWADADDDGVRPELGVEAAPEHQAAIDASASYAIDVVALELTGFDEAYVVTDAGTVALTAPLVVSAPRAYWGEGSRVGANAVAARYTGELLLGIAAVDDELTRDGTPSDELPQVILARDARLDVGPDHLRTLEDAPVRQALGADEALVASTVELRSCQADTLVFAQGQTRILELAYHQQDGRTDAVFSDAWVQDELGNMLPVRVQLSGDLPEAITVAAEQHPDAAWGQGIIDFVETWAEVTAAVVEGITCAFTFGLVCPGDDGASASPAELAPYPAWMVPAAAGAFELELTAPSQPGEHELVLHVVGQNYEASLPLHVIVQ